MIAKIKFEIEFQIHASPHMLYQYFGTPSGLSEWFADNVNSRGEIYTFIWNGSEEQAKVLQERPDEKIKFRWLDDGDDKTFFEFKIEVDEITKDVSLIVTDFAEEDEIEDSKMFWKNQIDELKRTIGA
ncbi:START-like domain-containing protein [Lutibacter sp.]|uniref:START-like domain-containing protein n=1 Tax=Lutibacter sp. TaxID=1925666 RepID=UPI0035653FF1